MSIPTITLNNGVVMPQIGLGVYLTPAEQTAAAVASALAAGYRHIDTAAVYGNEAGVGQGIAQSGIDRAKLFVTTKLWIADYGREATQRAFEDSLQKLGTDYLDLYLLHWPTPSNFEATMASWQLMEELRAHDRIRAIGVCNFTAEQIDTLIARTGIVPAVNQVELHPLFSQTGLQAANQARNIVTEAWSPLGGVYTNHPADPNQPIRLLDLPQLKELAAQYNKSPAQIVLRWHLQHGRVVIPKSVHAARMAENIDLFDFTLSDQHMAVLNALNQDQRGGPHPDKFDMDFLAARQS